MFIIKQNDLFPPIEALVKDASNVLVDVTGAQIKFSMRPSRNKAATKVNLATGSVVDGPGGKIRYTLAGTDSDTPGTYEAEFQVTPSVGSPMKVPTDGYITVIVEEKVA